MFLLSKCCQNLASFPPPTLFRTLTQFLATVLLQFSVAMVLTLFKSADQFFIEHKTLQDHLLQFTKASLAFFMTQERSFQCELKGQELDQSCNNTFGPSHYFLLSYSFFASQTDGGYSLSCPELKDKLLFIQSTFAKLACLLDLFILKKIFIYS